MFPIYARWDDPWIPRACTNCDITADGHATLFGEPPPEPPKPDERKPIGEVYLHTTRDDCVLPPSLAAAFRSLEKPKVI